MTQLGVPISRKKNQLMHGKINLGKKKKELHEEGREEMPTSYVVEQEMDEIGVLWDDQDMGGMNDQ